MKKIFTIIFTICLLASTSYAAEITSVAMFSVNQYNAIKDTEMYYVLGLAYPDTNDYSVYLQSPFDNETQIKMTHLPGWQDFSPNEHYYVFNTSAGYPEPGTEYEDIQYFYYADENNNDGFDEGEASATLTIPSGTIQKLEKVQNVKLINCSTIGWDETQSGREDYYEIRIFPLSSEGSIDMSNLLFQSSKLTPETSGSNSYTYDGDFLSDHEILAIMIDATELDSEDNLINRSRYIIGQKCCAIERLLSGLDLRLDIIRQFRDEVLSDSVLGRELISFYYQNSADMSAFLRKHPTAEKAVQKIVIAALPLMEWAIE